MGDASVRKARSDQRSRSETSKEEDIMSEHQTRLANVEVSKAAEDALGVTSEAMSQALQVPSACTRENLELIRKRARAYADFAQSWANCRNIDDATNAYAAFGNRLISDYVAYYQGLAEAMAGATAGGSNRGR